MDNQTVLVLDFGGQYKQLIARCVRDLGVYSVIKNGNISKAEVQKINPIGIILTGGPLSVYNADAVDFEREILKLGIPVLGICYGMQLLCHKLGGVVKTADKGEYGVVKTNLADCQLFQNLSGEKSELMSHSDEVTKLPSGFVCIASTANCKNAACANFKEKLFGVQFHPEVELSESGQDIIENFVVAVCGAKRDYLIDDYIAAQIEAVRARVGDKKILLGLSGGVDSSVCAALLSEAVGKQLYCVFVDHGFMRKDEGDRIEKTFSQMDLNFIRVNAKERFLTALKGISEPEQKRKIVGREFALAFQEEAVKLGGIEYLAQGTIYPDIVESGGGDNATIKSHHNVGGLPKELNFSGVIEPLAGLFKNEVRAMGKRLGLADFLVNRQPFPGPGLSVRIVGEVTEDKLEVLQNADKIWTDEVEAAGLAPSQYFAVLTNTRSVGVMGDFRTYENVIALRAVVTSDFMTCEPAEIPFAVLRRAATRVASEVKGAGRVVYDVTSKPPATVEWE